MLPIYLMNFLFAVSTTIGMTLIPLLVTDSLGLSLFILGIIEGSTELVSNILRLVTGNIFDRIKNRRLLFIIPTSLAFTAKLALLFPSAWAIVGSKLMERIANGAFAAPRDAYVGQNAKNKGTALGFLSSSKTLGCVLGPLVVSGCVLLIGSLKEHMLAVISLSCLATFICFLLSFLIKANKTSCNSDNEKFNYLEVIKSFSNLKLIFILVTLFFLGRFNDGVIMIHLKNQGFPEWFYLATISFFNGVMFFVSPFMGMLIDYRKESVMLLLTVIGLLIFNLVFYNLQGVSWFLAGTGLVFWGIQRAGAQITFAAMIFNRTPARLYGTAIGAYSLLSGFGIFIASMISGSLAQLSFKYIFMFSGTFSVCTLVAAYFVCVNSRPEETIGR